MNAVGVFTVMGALAGWVLGTATGARPAFVAVVCAIVALESSATASALDDPDRARAWRRVEFAALIVGVKLLHLFSIPGELAAAEIADLPRSIFENESLTGWIAGFMVWGLVLATMADLEVLASGVDDARESPVVVRVRARLVAVTAVLTLAAAYAAVGFAGVMTLRRSGQRGVFWVVTLFLGIGLLGLARVSYTAAADRWKRDGAVVEGPIQSRWMASAWIVAAVVLAVAIAAGGLSAGVSGLPAIGVSKLGTVGEWIADALERIGERQAQQEGAGVEVPAPADTLPEGGPEPGSRAGEIFVWLVLGTAIALALKVGGVVQTRSRGRGRSVVRLGAVFRALAVGTWSMLAWLARSIWSALRMVAGIRIRSRPETETGRGSPRSHGPPLWNPGDPVRARIADAYRRFLAAARSRGWVKAVTETPREYSLRVGGASGVDGITAAYEEARFSSHRLGDPDAKAAELAAQAAIEQVTDQ